MHMYYTLNSREQTKNSPGLTLSQTEAVTVDHDSISSREAKSDEAPRNEAGGIGQFAVRLCTAEGYRLFPVTYSSPAELSYVTHQG